MSLLLVRHGETALNAARVLQPPDTPLSPRGLAQAQAVALRLSREPVAAIVSSDLLRARQTAEAIAQPWPGLSVDTWDSLRERDFGDWRGLPYDRLPADPLRLEGAPPGGESQAAFAARCAQAWAALLALRSGLPGHLVVVSHGLSIRQWLRDVPPSGQAGVGLARLGNTAVSVVDAHPPHALRLFNCTQHLPPALQEAAHSLSGG